MASWCSRYTPVRWCLRRRHRCRRRLRRLPTAALRSRCCVWGQAPPDVFSVPCCFPRLLQLIMLDSVAVEVRQAAAVNFKNFCKYHWVSSAASSHCDCLVVECLQRLHPAMQGVGSG